MPAALTRFVQACFTAADATTDKAAMMVCNSVLLHDHAPQARVNIRGLRACDRQCICMPVVATGLRTLSCLHKKQDSVFSRSRQACSSAAACMHMYTPLMRTFDVNICTQLFLGLSC